MGACTPLPFFLLFWSILLFSDEKVDFSHEITEKGLKLTKKVETAEKVVQPVFGCAQHPKAGRSILTSN